MVSEGTDNIFDSAESSSGLNEHLLIRPPSIGEESNKSKTFKLSEYIRSRWRFITPFGTGDRTPIFMYHEETGIWEPDGEDFIRDWLANYLKQYYTKHLVSQVLSRIRGLVYHQGKYKELFEEGGPKYRMTLMNGVFDLKTLTFDNSFKPDEYHLARIPVKFDADADCPYIKNWFCEVMVRKFKLESSKGHNWIPQVNDIKAACEFIGFCLEKEYVEPIILMLLGGGENGKTVFLDLIRAFLGKGNVSSCTPQQLGMRFKPAQMYRKLANLAGDIPAKGISDTGILKMSTGGDPINAEFKGQDDFDFISYAKHIFSANKLPKSYDRTRAFHRRWRYIKFPRIFERGAKGTIPKNKLVEQLTTEGELSGLFNVAVKALGRLRENGYRITGTEDPKTNEQFATLESDLAMYFSIYCVYYDEKLDNTKDALTRDEVLLSYKGLCKMRDEKTVSKNRFHKALRRANPWLGDEDDRRPKGEDEEEESERAYVWKGLAINEDMITVGVSEPETNVLFDDSVEEMWN